MVKRIRSPTILSISLGYGCQPNEANKMLQDYILFIKKSKVRIEEYHHILMQSLQLLRVIAKKDPQLSVLVKNIKPQKGKRKKQVPIDTPTENSSESQNGNGGGI